MGQQERATPATGRCGSAASARLCSPKPPKKIGMWMRVDGYDMFDRLELNKLGPDHDEW